MSTHPTRTAILHAVEMAEMRIPCLRLTNYGIGDFHLSPTPPAEVAPDALVAVIADGDGGEPRE